MINTDTWGLFIWKKDGPPRYQIQRIDENPIFASDEEAVEHVYALADQGDTEALYAALCHGELVETINEMENRMSDFNEKLPLYKTAFSPLHEQFVQIAKVRYDEDGEPILDALMGGHEMMFRTYELTDYCL